jgi:MinD-like ATPase involved in chromosome partitioning or flagellar assembly
MSHSADYSDRDYPGYRDESGDYRHPHPLPRQPPAYSPFGYESRGEDAAPREDGSDEAAGDTAASVADPGAEPDSLPSEAYSFPTLPPLPAYVPEPYQPPVSYPPAPEPPPAAAPPAPDAGARPAAPRHYAPRGGQPQPAPSPPLATPSAPPRPEDLLEPTDLPLSAEPASWGWRGRVRRASGGLVKPKASAQEIAVRKAIHDIQRGFSRPMTVVVVQPKGGAGKTPTTICLAAAFGAHRGGYVVGWDDNETRGTLAVRVSNPDDQHATVWDLLGDLGKFERFDARVGDLSYYVRPQPDAHFDALVSDDNPGNMAQIGEDEFERLHTVLQRFYRLIVVDTGNNVRSPNWQAAVNAADLVVVVSTYQRDVGYSGSWVLDHLAQTGREELARDAVTVLTAADPTTDKTVRDQLLGHFHARTRAVVEIPYDPEIAHGGPIRWSRLAPATRNAWIFGGATIVNALAEHDQRALAARRG